MFIAKIIYTPTKWKRWFYLLKPSVFSGKMPLHLSVNVPSTWKELTAEHMITLAKCRFLIDDADDKRRYFVYKFFKLRPCIINDISPSDIDDIYMHVSKLLGDNESFNFPVSEISGISKLVRFDWIGPSAGGMNIRFMEFCRADQYYAEFIKTKNIKYLNLLVANLYRPIDTLKSIVDPKFVGDFRIDWNMHEVDHRALMCDRIALDYRYAVFFQYEGFRNWIVKKYPAVFSGGKPSKHGVAGVLISLAGHKFGDDEAVAYKPMHVILTDLQISAEMIDE